MMALAGFFSHFYCGGAVLFPSVLESRFLVLPQGSPFLRFRRGGCRVPGCPFPCRWFRSSVGSFFPLGCFAPFVWVLSFFLFFF